MRTLGTTARVVAVGVSWLFSTASAAIVEAGVLTTVAIQAPLYDTRLSAADGCDPAGCVGGLTRDGDATTLGSRWSCKPALGPAASACSITYTLGDSYTIHGLNIALYQGDTRTRTMEIYIDGDMYTTWTSSGTTSGFEQVTLGVNGKTVELLGVLEDSEWLSITEVEILVDDGVAPTAVEAGTVGTVATSATLYDTRLSAGNGCDPDGCMASLTRDGSMADASRWSCAPSLGGTCTISYDLGAVRDISEIRLALQKGATRTKTVEVYVDGALVVTWVSSGMTDDFESIYLPGTSGKLIEVTGVLFNSEWLSITEVEILVDGGAAPSVVEAGTLGTVTTSAALYDTRLSVDDGCDPAGCMASLTRDGNMADASRWSCAPSLGGTCTIAYNLGAVRDLSEIRLALYKGSTRTRTVEVYVDGTFVADWTSSGTTDDFESIYVPGSSGKIIEITGVLANSEWLSINEVEIYVLSDTDTPPTPTPTGDMKTVGLIPLAFGSGGDLEASYLKDGDFSTSWTCTGDPRDTDQTYIYYDCTVYFRLVYYRHIKQVKIALPDGATRAVDMRIAGRWNSELLEEFVTSSGTTDGFETYDVDYFTSIVSISGVFASEGQSISISEVELVEEVQAGEVPVARFSTPYDNGNGLWNEPTTDGFEWGSDSNEAIDRTLTFILSSYATATAIEMKFPVGDTYKFDLELYDGNDEAFKTMTGLESADTAGWQSFDLDLTADQYLTDISLVIKGTGSGAPGFKMLDARVIGAAIDNPTDTYYVGSTKIEDWEGYRYPDFVTEGTGDQKAIMEAICAVKKASFNGVDCEGGDPAATGTVHLPMGEWHVDGNIFMKSGVFLNGRFSGDDSPYTTDIILEEGAAGNTDIDAIVVMDGISDARIDDLWIRGLYDPETSNGSPAISGLGSTCLSITDSKNITCLDTEIRYCDGDAMVVRNSDIVNIDAGRYDDEYYPWTIGASRGTGLVVDSCDSVWVRRHTMYDNGVAGIHITGSNNFTFEATIGGENTEGEGNVGTVDGQQPIEVIVESSSLVTFQDMRVRSSNDPVMTVSADSSAVSFNNCGFSNVESGTCVIEAEDPSVVTAEDDELSLVDTCYVKV